MPSRNSKSSSKERENYQHVLNQLEEILNIYNRTHAVLILGDMNASLCLRNGNNQDILLKDFLTSNNMFCVQDGADTFFHPNKSDKAEIDYIFSNKHGRQILRTVSVDSRTFLNTSDHLPVVGTLNLPVTSRDEKKHTVREMKNRPWARKIHDAVKACRLARWEWRKSGAPTDKADVSVKKMRTAKRNLRKEQRQETAKSRREKVEEIMKSGNDSVMFYKLTKDQRKG